MNMIRMTATMIFLIVKSDKTLLILLSFLFMSSINSELKMKSSYSSALSSTMRWEEFLSPLFLRSWLEFLRSLKDF